MQALITLKLIIYKFISNLYIILIITGEYMTNNFMTNKNNNCIYNKDNSITSYDYIFPLTMESGIDMYHSFIDCNKTSKRTVRVGNGEFFFDISDNIKIPMSPYKAKGLVFQEKKLIIANNGIQNLGTTCKNIIFLDIERSYEPFSFFNIDEFIPQYSINIKDVQVTNNEIYIKLEKQAKAFITTTDRIMGSVQDMCEIKFHLSLNPVNDEIGFPIGNLILTCQ